MDVTIIDFTEEPIEMVSSAAGTSYGKSDYSEKRVRNCLKREHMSVFEHIFVTMRVKDISRACSHQLVRHRLASFVQQSQRYTKVGVWNDGWYVIPPDILDEEVKTEDERYMLTEFDHAMRVAEDTYCKLLDEGVKPEDARYVLPEATKTELVMTMNGRELLHFFDLRMAKDAQWEIRALANAIFDKLCDMDDDWGNLLNWYLIDKKEKDVM